jgi:hypothetical protein
VQTTFISESGVRLPLWSINGLFQLSLRFVAPVSECRVIQGQFGRGPLLRYCHASASYCISTLPLGNVVENERGGLSRV